MRQIPVTLSALTFFAMALVGLVMGQSPSVCALRALIGAGVSFVAARFAVQLALDVMIRSVVSPGQTATSDAGQEEHREARK